MSKKQITKGQVGNALTSTAADHILGVADDIFDEEQQRYQSEINRMVFELNDGVLNVIKDDVIYPDVVFDNHTPVDPFEGIDPPDLPEPTKLVWGVSKWGQSTW